MCVRVCAMKMCVRVSAIRMCAHVCVCVCVCARVRARMRVCRPANQSILHQGAAAVCTAFVQLTHQLSLVLAKQQAVLHECGRTDLRARKYELDVMWPNSSASQHRRTDLRARKYEVDVM